MKYMGSKSRIAKYIVPIIEDYMISGDIPVYIEPFVGGANIIDKITCDKKYGFDQNKYLIALLNRVKNGEELLDVVDREMYSEIRSKYKKKDSEYPDWLVGNVGFIASYNGRWFDGGFAEPSGGRDYYQEAKANLLSQGENLRDIEFIQSDFSVCLDKIGEEFNGVKKLIYCDPPYLSTKQYGACKHFGYNKFWAFVRNWSKDNIVLVSEETAPDDFECIWEMEVIRSIGRLNDSTSTEKLFKFKGEN